MAIACLRLVTRLPDRPEWSWPRFISCIARSTFFPALEPDFRPPLRLRPELRLLLGVELRLLLGLELRLLLGLEPRLLRGLELRLLVFLC
jgi:hypothetical protein